MSTCPPSETTEGPAIVVDAHHFILCQHGVLGSSNDLTGVVREVIISHDLALESHAEPKVPLSSLWSRQPTERHAQRRRAYAPPRPASGAMRGDARVAVSGNLWCFTPTNNNFFGTVVGTEGCAMGLLEESLPVVEAWLDAVHEYDRANVAPIHNAERADDGELEQPSITPPPEVSRAGAPPRCFSCIGHSFGGLILREYLFLLFTDDSPLDDASLGLSTRHLNTLRRARQLRQRFALEHISLENYATIASPHCGAAECLPRVLYWGAWVLRQLPYFSRTSGELLLTDKKHQLEQRLVDGPHLLALQLFRRRVLFANTHRDLLVGFGTGSLIYETVEEDLAKAFGDSPQSAPCASAFESDDAEVSAPILLSPYEATEEERSMLIHYYATRGISFDEGSTDEANLAYLHHHAHIRSFTLDDLQLLARHSTTEEDGSEAVVAGGRSPAPSCTSSAATTTPIVIVGSPASRPHTFPVAEVVSAADVMAFHRRRVKQHTPPPTTTTTTHASAELTDTPLGEQHNCAIGAEPPSTAVVRLRPTEKRMFCWLYELRLISGVRALGQAAATLYRRHASPIRSRGGLFRRPASAGDGVRDAPPLYDESTRPRAIAYRLRRHLTWQVRAVRYRSAIPMAHIAVLGNWGPLGDSSDSIVLSIAEELSQVLL